MRGSSIGCLRISEPSEFWLPLCHPSPPPLTLSGRELLGLVGPIEPMVLILGGNSEHVAHASRKIGLLREKKMIYD